MLEVLAKAVAFIAIIIIGYQCKKQGMFAKDDYKIVSKIILNMTLPAAVITSFGHFQMDYSLFVLMALGLICNILMMALALLQTRGDTTAAKLFYIFNVTGYNIGCFTMPFVQSFLGPAGVIAICMFDVGNSIMCTGMTFALAASLIGDADGKKEAFSLHNVLLKLWGSKPFLVYISMLLYAMAGLKVPEALLPFLNILAQANPFLCMLMIGMMFELNLDAKAFSYIKGVYLGRYLPGLAAAAVAYFYGPFSLETNKVLAAAFLAPATVIGLIFLEQLKGNVPLSGVANSLSIATSVILLTLFFTLTH